MCTAKQQYPRKTDVVESRLALLCDLGRAAKAIRPLISPRQVETIQNVIKAIRNNRHGHYVSWSLDDPCRVSYANGKTHNYDTKRRLKTSLGRYILRNCVGKELIHPAALDKFVNAAMSQRPGAMYKFLTGSDIRDAYRDGIGGTSCMTGDDSELLDVYVKNPDKVLLLVYESGDFRARALVWNCDDGSTCVDRIYPNDGPHIERIKHYAAEKNWLTRPDNSLPSGDVRFDGKIRSVTVKGASTWPYLDSFRSTDNNPESSHVTLHTCDDLTYLFENTDGGWDGNNRVTCYDCSERTDPEDCYSYGGEEICQSCYECSYFHCEQCSEIHHNDSSVYFDDGYYCEYCIDRVAASCDKCGEHVEKNDIARIDDCNQDWCSDCRKKNDAFLCEDCGNWYSSSDRADCECEREEVANA